MSYTCLYHYGVPGMKWGVKRSRTRLSNRVTKLTAKNEKLAKSIDKNTSAAKVYTAKSNQVRRDNSKYDKKIAKATRKKAGAELKLNKQLSKRRLNESKVGKYSAKVAKQNKKLLKAQKKLEYNKWEMKAIDAKEAADKARDKIKKNDKIVSMYSKTITAMDDGKIRQGRLFMQYAT